MRLALGLEYDGAAFSGWQTQADGNTVQDALERALRDFAGTELPTVCAGRTDAGVHATYQVVHIDTGLDRPLHNWVRGVNSFLPRSVAVRWCATVPEAFHARYGAQARRYEGLVRNGGILVCVHVDDPAQARRAVEAMGVHGAMDPVICRDDAGISGTPA